jgi:excisionase family DNA binding protein
MSRSSVIVLTGGTTPQPLSRPIRPVTFHQTIRENVMIDMFATRPDLLTVRETAIVLWMDRRRVYRAIHRGDLSAVRVGGRLMIPTAELDGFLVRELTTEDQRSWHAGARVKQLWEVRELLEGPW